MQADVQSSLNEFQHETTELRSLFQDFTAQSRAKSKSICFLGGVWGNGEAASAVCQS